MLQLSGCYWHPCFLWGIDCMFLKLSLLVFTWIYMGRKAYMLIATMGSSTVGWIVEFPCGRPSALLSVASTWILGIEWYFWPANLSFWTVVV